MTDLSSKVLVTGASGFVAEHLLPSLKRKNMFVVGLDRKHSPSGFCDSFVSADLNEVGTLEFAETRTVDVVIHLAAARADWGVKADEFVADNVEATASTLKIAKRLNAKKFIFVSSISVFGQDKKSVLHEHSERQPINLYGQTKADAEDLVMSYRNQMEVIIVRPTVIYGPSDPAKTGFYRATDNNIFRMIDAIERNRFAIPGDRSVVKSVCYVENIASFLVFLVQEQTKENEFLFADKEQLSISEIANLIKSGLGNKRNILTIPQWVLIPLAKLFDLVGAVLKVNFPINSSRVKTVNMSTSMEMSRAQEAGFMHPHTSKTGLEKTVDWYRQTIQGKDIDTFWVKKTDD